VILQRKYVKVFDVPYAEKHYLPNPPSPESPEIM